MRTTYTSTTTISAALFECAAFSAAFRFSAFNNDNPKPFVWTKTAQENLASAARFCKRISNSGHKQYTDKHGQGMPEIRNRKWSPNETYKEKSINVDQK